MKKLIQSISLIGILVLATAYTAWATFIPTSNVTTTVTSYCQSASAQTLNVPVTVFVGSANLEYIDHVSITAPAGIAIAHVSPVAGAGGCGTGSTAGLYFGVATQTVSWAISAASLTTPSGCGFWAAGSLGATQVFTVQITIPANYNSPISLGYNVGGDGYQCSGTCNCGTRSCLSGSFNLTAFAPIVTGTATPNPVCTGSSTTFTGGGAVSYTWTDGTNTPTDGTPFFPLTTGTSTYTVTGTSAQGCTATSTVSLTVNMGVNTTISQTPASPLCGVNALLTSTTTGGGGATPPAPGARYYIRDADPWGSTVFTPAMNAVFGAGNWSPITYAAATPATIFVPTTQFVYIEGSSGNEAAQTTYLASNQAAIEAWVSAGGRLLINRASNSGNSTQSFGFGGVMNTWANAQSTVNVSASHPIAVGPYTPAGTGPYTGSSYSHNYISGGSTSSIIAGGGYDVLTEKTWGNGLVLFGGYTAPSFHSPVPNAVNLFQNWINYCANSVQGIPYTYSWMPGAGASSTFTASTSGVYTVTVAAPNGCTTSATHSVTINPAVTVSAAATPANVCPGANSSLSATGADTYTWMPGSLTGATVSVTPGATTTYTVTGTSTLTGCTGTALVTVTADPAPVFGATTASPNLLCPGDLTALTTSATVTVGGTGPGAYNITSIPHSPVTPAGPTSAGPTGDDIISGAIPLPFPFTFYGVVKSNIYISTNGFVTFTNAGSGCCTGQLIPNASAPNDLIAISWEDMNVGAGQIDYFTVGSAPNRKFVIRYTSAVWYSGGGSPITGQIVLNEIDQSIEIHGTSGGPNASNNTTAGIENSTGTLATAIAGKNSSSPWTYANEGWRFSQQVITPVTNYLWDGGLTGNVVTPASQSTNANPSAATTYTVTATAPNGCTATSTVAVSTKPVLSGTASASPASICLGASTTFGGSVPNVCGGNDANFAGTYAPATWTFAASAGSTGSVNTAGAPANVILSAGNNGGFGANYASYAHNIVCAGNVSFNWATSASANNLAALSFPQYRINAGAWTNLTGYNTGGASVAQSGTQTIAAAAGDVIEIGAHTMTGDAADAFTLTLTSFSAPTLPASGFVDYWDAPTGGTLLGAAPYTVTPGSAGTVTYYAQFNTSTSTGCTNPVRTAVSATVNALPTVTASPSTQTVCPNGLATVTGGGASSYTWSGGITDATPFNATAATVYTVTGTDGNGCSNTATAEVLLYTTPTLVASATPATLCLGANTSLSVTGLPMGNVTIFSEDFSSNAQGWTLGTEWAIGATFAGTPATGNADPATDHSPSADNGVAGVVLGGNATTSLHAPYYLVSPVVNLSSMTTANLDFYRWLNSDYTPYMQNYVDVYNGSSWVNVWVSGPSPGIFDNSWNLMSFNITPYINSNFQFRIGHEVGSAGAFTVSSWNVDDVTISGTGTVAPLWTGPGSIASPTMATTSATPAVSGLNTYTVSATDGNGCISTSTTNVNVNPAPSVTATATPSTTCNNTVVIPVGGGATSYVWSGGLTDNTPFVATTGSTTYTVTGTDALGCTGTSTVNVVVNAASGTLAPATSNQSQNHADDFGLSYYDALCNLIASVDDGAGGNILGNTVATVNVDANAGTHNGQPFVRRWYQITPSSNVGVSATVTLYIEQADFTNYNTAVVAPYLMLPTTGSNADPNVGNIRITKNSDGGLGNMPEVITPTVNWNGMYWELTFPVTGFSQFRVHSVNPGNVPLPVSITKFDGRKLNSSDMLEWTTGSEQNNAYFNLQHSTNGVDFKTIGKVNSKAANGTSQTALNYNYEHSTPSLGHNYYRLEQVDIDGKASMHAKVVDLIWGANGSTVSLYPNPTQDVLNIDLYTSKVQNTTVKVLDMSGRVVKQMQARSEAGMNSLSISLGELASGVYTVQVYDNDKLSHVGKVKKN